MKSCKRLFFVAITALSTIALTAQQTGGLQQQERFKTTISGKVTDEETGDPLEFAAISVFAYPDTTLVTGTVSDIDGNFELKVNAGRYLVKFEYISYAPRWFDNVEVEEGMESYAVDEVTMGVSSETLEEVVVTAEKKQFELGLDKRVFNVEKDLITRNGNAAEVLDNIPSVEVDLDGNVSLRGSNNVKILIDGRPSGLVGLTGSDALRSLQGDMIERVEVITNPSARYEAEGMAGIINIVLKKDKRKGVNGAFNVYAGVPANHGVSGNINVRKNNLNFFADAGVRYRKSPGGGSLYQEYYLGDSLAYLEQTRDRERGGWSYNGRIGIDYSFTPNTTLTGSFMYRNGIEENHSQVVYRDFDSFYNLVQISTRDEFETETEPNFQYALNFRHLFGGSDKHSISGVLQYEDTKETEDADYLEQYFEPDGSPGEIPDLMQHRLSIEGQSQWLAQLDYSRPLFNAGKFETGYMFKQRDINNDFRVEELQDDEWEVIEGLTNNFLYDETIHAGYVIIGNESGRFDYQAGLRAEHSHIVTELVNTGEVNDRKYLDWFPSAHVGYSFAGENTLQVSYSRRIRRPHFRMLNPFASFSDARNIWTGNPDLDPEYTGSMEIGHIKYWDKASISSSVYYRRTTNVIQRIRTIDDEGVTVTMPENLAVRDAWGLEFTFSTDITPIWRIDGNSNFYRQIIKDDIQGTADNYSIMGRINSKLTLFKVLETQLRLNYRGPRETVQGRSKSMTYLDLGASMDILNKKGTLTLSISDIFNTRKYRYITEGEGFYAEGDFQWRATQATLQFTYRLNQKKRRGDRGQRGGFEGGDMDF